MGAFYRDVADSYRAKLLAEGYEVVTFPEGEETAANKNPANTIILLSADKIDTEVGINYGSWRKDWAK